MVINRDSLQIHMEPTEYHKTYFTKVCHRNISKVSPDNNDLSFAMI